MNDEITDLLRTIDKARDQVHEARRIRTGGALPAHDLDDVEMGLEWVRKKLENLQERKTREA